MYTIYKMGGYEPLALAKNRTEIKQWAKGRGDSSPAITKANSKDLYITLFGTYEYVARKKLKYR